MLGYIHFTIVLSISFLIFYVTQVDWPLDSVTQQSFIADTVIVKTSELLWCHNVLTIVSTAKIFPPRSVRTGFLKHLSNGDDVVSLISFSTLDSSSEALFDVLPQKNGGLTSDQNLSDFFWGWYWPTSCQNSSNAPCNIFLAIKSLAIRKKNPPLLVPLWWWASVRRPYKCIIYVHFICSKGQIQRTMMKTGGESPVCYFLLCFAVNAPLNLLLCTCAIDKPIECFFSHFFSPCTPALPTCNVPWLHLILFCLKGEMSSKFGTILQCIK